MKKALSGMTIYQVFVRNHSKEGTFQALIRDLERIKALGVDVLYLLPIHPIGVVARKGDYGSPYSIQDYQAISPDLGTLDDFKELVTKAHQYGLKVMMDMVFHHTSRDAIYMSRRATPTDNPIIESLNGWMKEEMLIDWNLSKAENVHKTVKQFIHYFNHERLAYALNYKSPIQYRTELGFN